MATTSQACQTIPPVKTDKYSPKGNHDGEVAGLKTYTVGSTSSTRGIIYIYDALGYTNQTFQGADRLAEHLEALVLMPDFFEGPALDTSIFQMGEEERKAAIGKFFAGAGDIAKSVQKLLTKVAPDAVQKYPSIKSWGAIGFCWGGKVSALVSADGTPFAATVQAHPGALAREDAEKIKIPHMCLASKDEPADMVRAYEEVIGSKGVVETYTTMHHGWMGGRAKMDDEENVKEFERGYKQSADFFAQHL